MNAAGLGASCRRRGGAESISPGYRDPTSVCGVSRAAGGAQVLEIAADRAEHAEGVMTGVGSFCWTGPVCGSLVDAVQGNVHASWLGPSVCPNRDCSGA